MTSAVLKYIAIIAMVIDHIGEFVISDLYGFDSPVYMWCKIIGRITFPIFAFLLVEGFKKTKNLKGYFFNILIFALLSEIPFDLVRSGNPIDFEYQNIMFTLLINLLMIYIMEETKIKNINSKLLFECMLVIIFSVVSYLLKLDYLFYGPLVIYFYYKFHDNKLMRFVTSEASFYFQFFSFVHISNILIYFYNGERGRQNKYFFYFFYPAHLLLIYIFKINFINWKKI